MHALGALACKVKCNIDHMTEGFTKALLTCILGLKQFHQAQHDQLTALQALPCPIMPVVLSSDLHHLLPDAVKLSHS